MNNYPDDIRTFDDHKDSPFNPESGPDYEEPKCEQCGEYEDECKCNDTTQIVKEQ